MHLKEMVYKVVGARSDFLYNYREGFHHLAERKHIDT